jgi:DNA-binding response OmpR family regulator
MSGLIHRLLPARTEVPTPAPAAGFLCPRVLVITVDVRFYADVLSAVNSRIWQVDWARSVESALAICNLGATPIVLYDENLPRADWRDAFDRLRKVPSEPRVLLAAREVDEPLWRSVLFHRGYDVVSRNADSSHLKRALRFAWLSICDVSHRAD